MPLGGETIGRAYVKILADGSGMDESIRREFSKAEPAMEAGGREHEKAYEKGFNDELQKNKTFEKGYRRKLDRVFGKLAADSKTLSGNIQKNIANAVSEGLSLDPHEVDNRSRLIGERVAQNIVAGLNEGRELKKVDFQQQIVRAIKEIDREMTQWERDWRRDTDSILNETRRLSGNIKSEFGKVDNAVRTVSHSVGGLMGLLERNVKDTGVETERFTGRLGKIEQASRKAGDGLGKMFGKGSRNDFINIVGSVAGAIGNLPSMLIGGFRKIVEEGSRLKGVFAEAGGGMDGFLAVAKDLGTKAGPALIAVLAGIELLVGPMAGLISGLAAAITALAGSLSFAIVGTLAPLAGAVLPLAAAIGGIGLAIYGVVKGSKEMKAELKPVGKEFQNLAKIAAEGVFGESGQRLGAFADVLKKLEPLVRVISKALGSVLDGFLKSFDSPGFKTFLNTMGAWLPGAIRNIGDIVGNVFGGIAGVFRSLTGPTSDFLGWLAGITQQFSNWAQSAKGQEALSNFFTRAQASAKVVWRLILDIGRALGKLLSGGKETGDSIFESLDKQVRRFIAWLDDHPDALKQWFADGKRIAEDVGNAIMGIVHVFDNLDTPFTRRVAAESIHAVAIAFDVLAASITAVKIAFWPIKQLFRGLVFQMQIFLHGLSDVLDTLRPMFVALSHMPNPFGSPAIAAVKNMAGGMVNAIDKVHGMRDSLDNLQNKLSGTNEKIKQTKGVINSMPDAVTVDVHANTAEAERALLRYGGLLRDLDGKTAQTFVKVNTEHMNTRLGNPTFATGGVVLGPTRALIGESGPEAVVPLRRALSQVDPAVRQLSAIAQGMKMASGGVVGTPGKVVNVGGMQIITPTKDPSAVASEVVNRLVGVGY